MLELLVVKQVSQPSPAVICKSRAVLQSQSAARELAQALCSLCGATFAALGRVDAIHADSGAICEIERIAANDSVY